MPGPTSPPRGDSQEKTDASFSTAVKDRTPRSQSRPLWQPVGSQTGPRPHASHRMAFRISIPAPSSLSFVFSWLASRTSARGRRHSDLSVPSPNTLMRLLGTADVSAHTATEPSVLRAAQALNLEQWQVPRGRTPLTGAPARSSADVSTAPSLSSSFCPRMFSLQPWARRTLARRVRLSSASAMVRLLASKTEPVEGPVAPSA
mmetsp:Transcript_26525/g.84103  ORF Transcript_26525/g.84103 Transcript_26525/m.84103 type:complete len:203 (-) Transcript_26525:23-631(-)